jgi:hypothetical protein
MCPDSEWWAVAVRRSSTQQEPATGVWFTVSDNLSAVDAASVEALCTAVMSVAGGWAPRNTWWAAT